MKKRITAILLSAMLFSLVPAFAASAEDDLFKQTEMQFTGINTTRAENTLIIYRGRETTGTNTWGYEVVCDKEGTVVSVGGNNNAVPEGGFVLSAIGTFKQPLINAAKLGMTVTLDESAKKFSIGYTREGIGKKFEITYGGLLAKYRDFEHNLYEYDGETAKENIVKLENLKNEVIAAASSGDETLFAAKDKDFTSLAEETEKLFVPHYSVQARTIWLRIPTNKNERAVQNTVKAIKDLGFNSVCIEAMFDNSMIVPMPEDSLFVQNPAFGGADMLKMYIDEFHKYGIEVHLWMSCYRAGYEGTANTKLSAGMKKPEWRCISAKGKDKVSNEYGDAFFLNPALPEVKETLLETYKYFLENYDIDGFQLDYVRYPEVTGEVFGYDDYTKSEFLKKYTNIKSVPTNSGQNGWQQWTEFRAAYVTDLVRSVKEMINEIRPDVWFSCDVAPASLSSLPGTTCQDSRTWIKEGLVDIIYPMAYGTTDAVAKWTRQTLDLCGDKVYAVMGLRDNGPQDYLDQITVCGELGAAGTAFFSYSQYIAGKYKGNIEKTAFGAPAVNPTSSTKETVLAALDEFTAAVDKYLAAYPPQGDDIQLKITDSAGEAQNELRDKSVSECSGTLERLCAGLEAYAEEVSANAPKDDKTGELAYEGKYSHGLSRAAKRASGIIRLALNADKDGAKAAYAAAHTAEESKPEAQSADTENSKPEASGSSAETSAETSAEEKTGAMDVVNKIFQVMFIVVMTTGLIGLPLYYYLDKRRKRLKAEYGNKDKKPRGDEPEEPEEPEETDAPEETREGGEEPAQDEGATLDGGGDEQ